jgi:hypothetical protein
LSEEEQVESILDQAWVSMDKDFRKQAVDTVAEYGQMAINHLLKFNNRIVDEEIKGYVIKKIQVIKSKKV